MVVTGFFAQCWILYVDKHGYIRSTCLYKILPVNCLSGLMIMLSHVCVQQGLVIINFICSQMNMTILDQIVGISFLFYLLKVIM